jgi:hypothetical protein
LARCLRCLTGPWTCLRAARCWRTSPTSTGQRARPSAGASLIACLFEVWTATRRWAGGRAFEGGSAGRACNRRRGHAPTRPHTPTHVHTPTLSAAQGQGCAVDPVCQQHARQRAVCGAVQVRVACAVLWRAVLCCDLPCCAVACCGVLLCGVSRW